MDCLSPEVLGRMPLAESVLSIWRSLVSEERLQPIWDQHRGRCYDKVICFPVIVQLISDALLKYGGSGRRSFEKGVENGSLEASVTAAFGKLGRLPIAVSQSFLEESAAQLQKVFPPWAQWQGPKSLQHLQVVILDGKAIKNVAKRLKPLRGCSGGLLGGRALVAIDWTTELVIGMHAHADGQANDVAFVEDLVPVVRRQISALICWVADRAFGDPVQTAHFTAREGDHFVVRYTKRTQFVLDSTRPQQTSKNDKGETIIESWGWLGAPSNKLRRYVRHIELQRKSEEPIFLVTDLLEPEEYPVEDLLWLYRERWGIEQVFQKVTEVFGLSGLIGSTPSACIFQFAMCLLLYNIIQIVRGYIAQAQDMEPDQISMEKLFEDIKDDLIAWNVLLKPHETVAYFKDVLLPEELRERLTTLLAPCWTKRWSKSPPQVRKPKATRKKTRTHSSVERILHPPPQTNAKSKPKKT